MLPRGWLRRLRLLRPATEPRLLLRSGRAVDRLCVVASCVEADVVGIARAARTVAPRPAYRPIAGAGCAATPPACPAYALGAAGAWMVAYGEAQEAREEEQEHVEKKVQDLKGDCPPEVC